MLLLGIATGLYESADGSVTPLPDGLSLELAKQHLRVRHEDEDTLIAQYLAAATTAVERITSKLMTRREVKQPASAFGRYMHLNWGPEPEGLAITYLDGGLGEQTIADARIAMGRAFPNGAWPHAADGSVMLTYTAGFTTVPHDLIAAVLLLVEHLYTNRTAASDKPVIAIPMGVESLTDTYRPAVA